MSLLVPADACPAEISEVLDPARQRGPAEIVSTWESAEGIRGSFLARVEAQEAIRALHAAGGLDHRCVTAIRRADSLARVRVDAMYEGLSERPDEWQSVEGGRPALRTGDLLVTRAVALSSAGIGHLGGVDSHFSHNALIYVAPDGEVWTVSAFMEKGAVVEPLDAFLGSGLGRVVVLRHEDRELADRAGTAAYERVSAGPFIPYDDKMDDGDSAALFCSEVARWAYGPLLGLPATIPFDATGFAAETQPLLQALGVDRTATSMPGDALYDPRFSVVAEWRSVDDLATMRRHDAVAESLMSWVEDGGYVVDPTVGEAATVRIGLALRRTPVLALLVRDRILPTSDRDFLLTGLAFDTAGHALDERLVEEVGAVSLGRGEWLAEIEALRAADEVVWRSAPRRSEFHRTLHPR